MKKILVVFGTRPEAIKMAPLILKLKEEGALDIKICVTGQHQQMLKQVLRVFNIKPDFDLKVMKKSQNLEHITSDILKKLSPIVDDFNPDLILVHGDTTTTFAAALLSYYKKIKLGHVEAGLRTGNIYSPWPEEINRKFASIVSHLHFCPTEISKKNLLNEGIDKNNIFITGNTVIDALMKSLKLIKTDNKIRSQIIRKLPQIKDDKKIILVTGHRRESFGDGFKNICSALKEIAIQRDDVEIIYPVHLNPQVQKPVLRELKGIDNIKLISPLDYLPFIFLMDKSYLILTDSGGVQEEAPSLGKPVLVMREVTERPEAVRAGTVKLTGPNKNQIVTNVMDLLDNKKLYRNMSEAHNPYGDGKASDRILKNIINKL